MNFHFNSQSSISLNSAVKRLVGTCYSSWFGHFTEQDRTVLSNDTLTTTKKKFLSYFRKFVKNWNRGRLPSKYYQDTVASQQTASASTSYKWAFASGDRVSEKDIKGTREAVRTATNGPFPSSSRPVQGPALPASSAAAGPSLSDRQWEREMEEEKQQRDQRASRKRAREEYNDRVEDAIGPRELGRERLQENKKARRENDRAFRDKDYEPDIDADALMGGDSFQAR